MSVKIGNLNLGDFPLLLAPMEDVSDPPFRALCKEHGADVMYTEFVSSEGLIRDAKKSVQKLDIYKFEKPIGIQIFGNNIYSMRQATEICEKANPDIIDINYGCPVKKIACKGSGAGILQDIPKMIAMTKEIVSATNIPVTVILNILIIPVWIICKPEIGKVYIPSAIETPGVSPNHPQENAIFVFAKLTIAFWI